MEMSSLPVDLTVIWNGDFSIDNPAQNKGETSETTALLLPMRSVSMATDQQHLSLDTLGGVYRTERPFCLTFSPVSHLFFSYVTSV